MHRPYGLRPRLLASLLVTSAATLLVAALALLGPLQDRLREESARTLQAAVIAARADLEADLRERFFNEAYALSRRTDSRVIVWDDATLAELYDTETGDAPAPRAVVRALID